MQERMMFLRTLTASMHTFTLFREMRGGEAIKTSFVIFNKFVALRGSIREKRRALVQKMMSFANRTNELRGSC